MIGDLKALLAAMGGAAAAVAVAWTYNVVIDNPSVVKQAEAVIAVNTYKAIGEIRNDADKARAMRRFCHESGRVYNFATVECGEESTGSSGP